ncbi:hypothetical protein GCM10027589_01880 [Actinocorallia lasiicapitis]
MKPSATQVANIRTAATRMTDADRDAISRSNSKTYDYLLYGSGKRGMTTRVDRIPPKLPNGSAAKDMYHALDRNRPTMPLTNRLQGQLPPTVGRPDPAYADGRLVTGVAFDHIIPLRRLVTMRGFLKLTPENMWLVANSPANSQWLSKTANSSKLSGSSAFIAGADPQWLQAQAQLRLKSEREVQQLINALLKTQKG